MRVLDTFAGAGGFSLGFQDAGMEVIGAIEKDAWAAGTFGENHPSAKVLTADLEFLSDEDLKAEFENKSPDVVIGGPPCQGFSICNQNAGDPSDPRNTLFTEFLRVVDLFDPTILVLENVPNLVNAKTESGEPVINIIVSALESLGYYVDWEILEATRYGVPQIRKRLFVVGSKGRLDRPFPKPTHIVEKGQEDLFHQENGLEPCPVLWDAISDLPALEAGQGEEAMPYNSRPETEYQKRLRNGQKEVYNHVAMNHTKRVVKRFQAMSWGDSVSDVPDHLRPLKRNGGGERSETTYDQNNRRMHPSRPCHTIPASFYANFVHPFQDRNFTAREGARIQSFPDDYVFTGKRTVVSKKLLKREGRTAEAHLCQYEQIGNAVPPLLAKAIASNLLQQIS